MFCPECSEVMGPGPIDRRRASHCKCGADERAGTVVRLWCAIWKMFSRAKPIKGQPRAIKLLDTALCHSNDRTIGE